MPQPKSKRTAHDRLWADCFQRLLQVKSRQPIGEGWRTTADILKELKICRGNFYKMVRVEVSAGRMECFRGTEVMDGRVRPQVWYRPKGRTVANCRL